MATEGITFHHPHSLLIPEGMGLVRDRLPAYPGMPKRELEYPMDSRTIFFDVFRSAEAKKIIAIGPEMRNLRDKLLPLKILCGGRALRYKMETQLDYTRLRWKIGLTILYIEDPRLKSDEEIRLTFCWRSFKQELSIGPSLFDDCKFTEFTLMAIQKDSPPIWISDRCRFFNRVHNVSRIVLYDNDSSNLEDIKSELQKLSKEMEIHLVHWNFPFGPPSSEFAQRGALNHCYWHLKDRSKYFLNFDIDEYLVNRTSYSLSEYLNRTMSSRIATLNVIGRNVPSTPQLKSQKRRLRANDHEYHLKLYKSSPSKTIFKGSGIKFVSVHRNLLDLPRFTQIFLVRYRSIYRMYRKLNHLWLKFKLPIGPYKLEKQVDPDELYFNHYKSLTTDWRLRYRINPPKPFNPPKPLEPHQVVYDPDMCEHLKRANIL